MDLMVMSLNTLHGGRRESDGTPCDRWPAIVETITRYRPHILLLQEMQDWLDRPALQAAAEVDLGMRVMVATSATWAHTAVMWRQDLLRWRNWEGRHADQVRHGFSVAVFEVPGLTTPLTVVCAHLTPWTGKAVAEVQHQITRLYAHGGLGLLGGDINHVPLGDPEPDWDPIRFDNHSSRMVPGAALADRTVAQVLHTAKLTDVAAHLAETTGDKSLRAPTGRYLRVDQVHVTPQLVPALTGYARIPTASDHNAIVVDIDTDLIEDRALEWT